MKRGSTLFLKITVFLMAAPILVLCVLLSIWLVQEMPKYFPELVPFRYLALIGIYLSAIAYFIALFQAYKLLNYIDSNKAFADTSITALKNIKYCAITISGIYVIGLPFIYQVADLDDAPGLMVIGLVIIFASLVIAVFAAVLQRLLQEVIHIKTENEFTV
ncbi:DUF2975 domain-containing protein [Ornithinibacillus gellani]|uniref:DUF2975 domain-containing protein n=1 Tax=Ornithinibacillus gellani TaxID=2293253 RepID=UPI000F4A231D|nr:DUF2975 domain-containing protein [Ornithinibacillus gellani]TQS70528.1 DUF2975 domain-containing protein [Ornithinibacillus gellani]